MFTLAFSQTRLEDFTSWRPIGCGGAVKLRNVSNLSNELSQPRVAEEQPASGSDAVGFILKLARLKVTEVFKPDKMK